MNLKSKLAALDRYEREGVTVVIDGPAWVADGPRDAFPLDPSISPARCELVAEGRRVARMIETRQAEQPEDVVYRNSTAALEAALTAILAYIETHKPKGKSNAKPADDPAEGHEQDAPDRDDDSDPEPALDARGKGKHSRRRRD